MIQILLNGCCGKMGKVITDVISQFPDLNIIAGVDKYPCDTQFPVFTSLSNINTTYDVLLDFSRPTSLESLILLSEKTKKPLILCTTGYSSSDLDLIKEKADIIPIFKSANMSYGINLINILLKKITPLLYDNYDIEIIEKHHNQKVDSPSGTALLLANTISNSIDTKTNFVYGRYGKNKRKKEEIALHAIRGGSIVGDHEIIFAGTGEVIELTHKAISREVFAIGALKACEYMSKITSPGLYDMESMLNF